MSESIAKVEEKPREVVLYELMQRKARTFANSPLVPQHIRGENEMTGIANCYICLVLAEQMNENPLVVMQNIYIVHGKPGWSASYMIAKANASGIFKGVIRFKHEGAGPTRKCTASATLKDTGETVEVTMSMETANAEGWTKNSKYKTMPDQMLAYRAATLLVRLYCPQVMLGYHTDDEIRDVAASMGAEDVDTNPKSVVDTLKARVAEVVSVETAAVPDAVVEEAPPAAPAPAKLPANDMLTRLIAEYAERGGEIEDFAAFESTTVAEIKASKTKARATWCDKLEAALRSMREGGGA